MFVDFNFVKKLHGDKARGVYTAIANIAGGDPNPYHEGGMDLTGLDPAKMKQVKELLEVKEEKKGDK